MTTSMKALALCPLFAGIPENELGDVLTRIDAQELHFKRGDLIEFDSVRPIAAVLEGLIQIVQDDYWGTRSIIHMLMPGKTMGESFTTFPGVNLNQKAIAQTECRLLAFSKDKLLDGQFPQQRMMLENLLRIYSIHQRIFLQKFQILSRRKTRDRLLAYLSAMALEKDSPRFSVPFTRQELADFLCVERSAMCAELSAMQKEGILRFKGKEFELIHQPEAEHQN